MIRLRPPALPVSPYSIWYDAYLWVRRPKLALRKAREFAFYRGLLGTHVRLIFDIGADAGHKTNLFRRLARCVVAVEPDPASYELLCQRFRKIQAVQPRRATIAHPDAAFNAPVTTLDALIREFGVPDYIRLDNHGAELSALRGLRTAMKLISFRCNPASSQQLNAMVDLLVARDQNARFNYVIDEPPSRLEMDEWVSASDLLGHVRSHGYEYIEVLCRSTPAHQQ